MVIWGCSVASVVPCVPVFVSIYSPKTFKTSVMFPLSNCDVVFFIGRLTEIPTTDETEQ